MNNYEYNRAFTEINRLNNIINDLVDCVFAITKNCLKEIKYNDFLTYNFFGTVYDRYDAEKISKGLEVVEEWLQSQE